MRLILLLLPLLAFGCEETVYRPGEPPQSVELSAEASSAPTTTATLQDTDAPGVPAAHAATGESSGTHTSAAATEVTTTGVSEADLNRYVDAFIKLQILEQRTQHRIDEAAKQGDQEAIRRAAEEADVVARGILSESGISRDEFLRLREQIQNDPELNARGKALFDRKLKEAGLDSGN